MQFFVNVVVIGLMAIYPLWRIFRRVGLPPYYALAVFIPAVGMLLVMLMLANSAWPAFKNNK
ncbi:hypothetical protein DB032_08285 [Chromobacterium sp. Panama]|uniref:hypothetical protein n=1 Tax=Chromobacterium sp. Panama TaxID=2161826 RepID=UPI000D323D5A|nr:hypothetical protein [Chromobacterium sp. Panama]PTU64916.1 hypothetical protein DB032_08285 [Chromobacterium sp. Panama]